MGVLRTILPRCSRASRMSSIVTGNDFASGARVVGEEGPFPAPRLATGGPT